MKNFTDYMITRAAAASVLPVDLADIKRHSRVDFGEDDDALTGYLTAAVEAIQEQAGKAFITQTWQVKRPMATGTDRVYLPYAPAQSITSIAYYDGDNASQTATVSNFNLFGDEDRAWIEPKASNVWPSMYDRPDAVTITYVAGYGATSADVPANIRQAIRMLAAHWYENREAVIVGTISSELPMGVQHLVGISRVGWAAG